MSRLILAICLLVGACSTTQPPLAIPPPPSEAMLPPSQLKTLPAPSSKTTVRAEKIKSASEPSKSTSPRSGGKLTDEQWAAIRGMCETEGCAILDAAGMARLNAVLEDYASCQNRRI